jgi:hypothetical protein
MQNQTMYLSFGGRIRLGLAGLLLAILMYGGMAVATAPKASATNFCEEVTLAPYGSYGDRCYAWPWESGRMWQVGVLTRERAGCVTTAAANSGDLLEPWLCVGKESQIVRWIANDGRVRRGVIRNNNSTYSGRFTAFYSCCLSS